MLKIKPLDYQFCPFCSKKLQIKVEENKKRKYCSSCRWTYYPRVAQAAAAVIVKDKKVLLVRRKREPFKGTWMFPAGFVDFGEHPLETLRREIKEETGLRLKTAKFIDIVQAKDDPRELGHLTIFYRAEVFDGHFKNDDEENEKIAWFDISKAPQLGFENHHQIMKFIQKKFKSD